MSRVIPAEAAPRAPGNAAYDGRQPLARRPPAPAPAARAAPAFHKDMPALMQFDLTDLRLFVAIAETDSLTKGAERVHTSASAASVRIKNLEERLGVKLLLRSSQGVSLTPPGQSLAHHARQVMGQLEHLHHDLLEYAQGVKGHLRLYASTTAMTEFLPRVLGRYLAAWPDVNIELKEQPSTDIVRAVADGRIDLGIVSGTARTQGLEVRRYHRDRLVLVVPAGHPLATQPSTPFLAALDYHHVGLHEGSAIHVFLGEVAAALNRKVSRRIQVGNFEAGCRMVESGVGVLVMPESAARRYAAQLRVAVLALQDDWAVRNLQICARSFQRLPGFAQDLVQLLEQDVREAAGPL